MKVISKINKAMAKAEGAIMVFWFAIVLIVMTCQVISRYIFNAPIAWSEEFARYSFVWISYFSAARIAWLWTRIPVSPRPVTCCRPRP